MKEKYIILNHDHVLLHKIHLISAKGCRVSVNGIDLCNDIPSDDYILDFGEIYNSMNAVNRKKRTKNENLVLSCITAYGAVNTEICRAFFITGKSAKEATYVLDYA